MVPGFTALPDGRIRTFSRGGSDISGAIVARAACAEIYENWTDFSGFLMADPRVVKMRGRSKASPIRSFGSFPIWVATVLHEDSVFPVHRAGIPTNIRNTNCPEHRAPSSAWGRGGGETRRSLQESPAKKGFPSFRWKRP